MSLTIALALAAATAAPTKAPPQKPATAAVAAEKGKSTPDPMQAMQAMMKMFDRFFPAGPEPDPARLTVARSTALTMMPNGSYSKSMVKFMDNVVERALDMSEADFANMFPDEKPAKAKKGAKPKKPPSTEPLRVTLARDDPQFDAKKAAIRAFVVTMMDKVGAVAEPKLREGMARSLARKFDGAQLAEINAFLATPTGNAYGREMLGIWFEPDVLRGAFQLFPELMKMAPEMMGDAVALDAALKGPKDEAKDKK